MVLRCLRGTPHRRILQQGQIHSIATSGWVCRRTGAVYSNNLTSTDLRENLSATDPREPNTKATCGTLNSLSTNRGLSTVQSIVFRDLAEQL